MNHKTILSLFLALSALSGQASEKLLKTFHVSPKGADTNTGTEASPLKSLHAAQAAVRKLRSQAGNIEVIVHGGTYSLDKTLHFTNADSAPAGSYTIFKAAAGQEPILSGGKKISNWQKLTTAPEGLPTASLGKVYAAKLDWLNEKTRFHALVLGEDFLPRSSSKNSKLPQSDQPISNTKTTLATSVSERSSDITPSSETGTISKIWKSSFSRRGKWLVNFLPLKSIDTAKKEAVLNVPATYSMSGSATIENAIDFLDEPGEWCINTKTQMIYYWPKADNQKLIS